MTKAGCSSLILTMVASSSVPSTDTAKRETPAGVALPATASVRLIKATALGMGSFSNSSAGTTTPVLTSINRRRAVLAAVFVDGGMVRRKIESDVAISLNGMPTADL